MPRRLRREEYTVAWICAHPVERAAAQGMLDEEHDNLERYLDDNDNKDNNLYALGSMGGHHVVIVCLSDNNYLYNLEAARNQIRATFKGIQFGLTVGIGGGVPSAEADIRLGDVVVSQPSRPFGGVVNYDMNRVTRGGLVWTNLLHSLPSMLPEAVTRMRANEFRGKSRLSEHLSKLNRIPEFQRSKTGPDILFEAAYDHMKGQTCDLCSTDRQVTREQRRSGEEVVVHYGTIASSYRVMKSAVERDRVSTDLGGVLCFEMERADSLKIFPCLVIRGICDYADSHMNKKWVAYAAATAAACAKELLLMIPPEDVATVPMVEEDVQIANNLLSSSPVGVNITSGHRSVSTMPTYHFSSWANSTSGHRSGSTILANHSSLRVNSTSGHRSVSTMPTDYSSFGKQSEIAKDVVDSKVTSVTLDPFIELQEAAQNPLPSVTSKAQEPTYNAEEDDSDIYSDAGSLRGNEDDMTEKFAEWFYALIEHQRGETSSHDVLAVLPELLQEFAIRLGHEGKKRDYRNLMYVAHKPRAYRTIAKMLGEQHRIEDQSSEDDGSLYDEGDDEALDDAAPSDDEMDWKERINALLNHPNTNEPENWPSALFDPYDTNRQILKDAEATAWLLSTLNRDLALDGMTSSVMRSIRVTVLGTLRGLKSKLEQKISRGRNPIMYTAHFQLQWDPVAFCNQEISEGEPRDLIWRVITVTGEGDSFQALPCEDYMMQTWPLAASTIITLLQGLVSEPDKDHVACLNVKSGSWLEATLKNGNLHLVAKGTDFEIAEVAEQLAWLGAALQSSDQFRYYICRPELSTVSHDPGIQLYDTHNEPPGPFFRIEFSQSALSLHDMGQLDHSQCWLKLFENMAIVHGFPIPSRPRATFGLEVPLEIAANIIGADKVVPFKDRLIIKGFSTMLYPTKANFEDGTISWHLLESDDGARITYADPKVGKGYNGVQKLQYKDLEIAQHIIGWCQNVENITGTKNASYAIRSSNLKPPPRGWALEKIQIAAGKYVVPALTFARGTRVRALKVSKKERDYIGHMEWLAEKHVILHDTLDRRAWLVDGQSALLHLTRASFSTDSRRFPNQNYSTILDGLEESQDRYTGRFASEEVLTKQKNLDLVIRSKKDTANQTEGDNKYRFRDRVKDLFNFLEQMIDHQEDMKDGEGIGFMVSHSPWNRLVGFDFIDIARRSDPCEAKSVKLNDDGEAWVDFTRAIHAVTLFGQGFGDLLRPAVDEELDSCVRCHWNSYSPNGRDILAVSMADLEYLHLDVPQWDNEWDHGKPGARTVIQKFIWDRPASTFTPCACAPNQSSPARLQTFRKHSEGSKTAWMKNQCAPDTGQVYRTGAILMGICRSVLHKSTHSIATDASQSSFLSSETAIRRQRTPSLRSQVESRYTSVSTTSTQRSSDPLRPKDIDSSTQVASITEEENDQRDTGASSTGTSSGVAPPPTSRSKGKRPINNRLQLDAERSMLPRLVKEADQLLDSSLDPDPRYSYTFARYRKQLPVASQSALLSPETATRRQRTLSLSPQVESRCASASTTSTQQSSNPLGPEDVGISTQVTPIIEGDNNQRDTGTFSRVSPAHTSRSEWKRRVNDRLQFDAERTTLPHLINAPRSWSCDTEAGQPLDSSLGLDLHPSMTFAHRMQLTVATSWRGISGGRSQLRRKAGKWDLASARQHPNNG